MKGKNLITTALLAGLMLASSCNSSRHAVQPPDNRSMTAIDDRIISRVGTVDTMPVVRDDEGEMYSAHTLIISYDTEVGTDALDSAVVKMGAEVLYRYRIINAIAIRIPDGLDINDAIATLSHIDGVLAVNRDRIYHLH